MNLTPNSVLSVLAMGLAASCPQPLNLHAGDAATNRPDPIPQTVTVATWNLEWFFDSDQSDNRSDLSKQMSAPSAADWEWKLDSVTRVIAFLRPTILCLQEVENRQVVYELTQKLRNEHKIFYRYAIIDGLDFFTEQEVAIIYQSGLVQYSRREQSQEMWDSEVFYNLQKHLIAEFEWGEGSQQERLTILNVHLRAQAEGEPFRRRQCRLIHKWLEDRISQGENVIVAGDLNTAEIAGEAGSDSDIALAMGLHTDNSADDLFDLHEQIGEDLRATHISGRQFDRLLISKPLLEDDPDRRDLVFSRAIVREDLVVQGQRDANHFDDYYGIPEDERDISDHYPVIAEFVFK